MKIKVVSTWNNNLFKKYAHRFQKTYNWPFELEIYNEDDDMFDRIPELKEFITRNHVDIPRGFLYDACRFAYKVYAYTQSILETKDYDGLMFIDADTVFHKKIDEKWVKKYLHREDKMITHLHRPTYTECGFIYFNMRHNFIKQFAAEMRKMYDEDLLFKEDQQHDSFIFDIVRNRMEREYNIENYNIGDGRLGHVQARSILGTVMDHTKGDRKIKGRSKENLQL